tara:strand:+ start:317 stop:580 length:264 start_codon:yes stop_codon:yes gene_type:complete
MELLIDFMQFILFIVGGVTVLSIPILYLLYPFIIRSEINRLSSEIDLLKQTRTDLLIEIKESDYLQQGQIEELNSNLRDLRQQIRLM